MIKHPKNKIIILGIDTLSPKNKYQLKAAIGLGFEIEVFTNDKLNNSNDNIFTPHKLNKLKKSPIKRFFQVFKFVSKNKGSIHHIEIYPGGRYSYIYLFLAKIFKQKTITVERGELLFWKQRKNLHRFFLQTLYNQTNLVWYRELYMKKVLDQIGVKKMFFLHNCCDSPPEISTKKKDIDFLWVNRLIIERKVEWALNYISQKKETKTIIVGNKDNDKRISHFFKNNNCENITVKDYLKPHSFYKKSRFFILPSDIVFANNSLLEAMSYGVVPLISDVSGSNLIVDHLESGYIFSHTYEGFKEAIEWAINLDKESYDKLSMNARLKVENDFSFEKFKTGYHELIQSI